MFKQKLKTALLAGASLALLTAPLAAQQIDEVVVTAEKRSASLQDIPIAITAISQETLELQNVENVNDLNSFAPNLVAKPGTVNRNASVLAIRGIGISGEEMLTQDAPTGVYIDGVPITKGAAMSVDLEDIEQVEVLRGPQGTLFGRNAIGGAVSFKTRRPGDEPGLTAEAGIGNYGLRSGTLKADLGELADGFRLGLSIGHETRDGVIDNILAGADKDPGAYQDTKFRVAFDWDITETINAYYAYDKTNSDNYQNYYQTMAFNRAVYGTGYDQILRGTAAANPGLGCPSALSTKRLEKVCVNDLGKTKNDTEGHILNVDFALDGMTLRSVTGRREWNFNSEPGDLNGFGALAGINRGYTLTFPNGFTFTDTIPNNVASSLFSSAGKRHHKQFSQELTLISEADGPLRWVAGVFYLEEEGKEQGTQYIYLIGGNPMAGIPVNTFISAASPAFTMDSESQAIYGQLDYDLNEQLTLSGGVRYTEDEMKVVQTAPRDAIGNRTAKFSKPTGHITADYKIDENMNTYAKISRGYRSGGFAARNDGTKFDEETATSYEVGVKTQYDRFRFNAAIFSTDYKDRQISQPVESSSGAFGNNIVNASKQTIHGIELELDAALTEQISLSAAYGYIDVETKGFMWNIGTAAAPNVRDISGELLNTDPENTANLALTYADMTPMGDLTARINANYTDSYHSFANAYSAQLARQVVSKERTLIDAQIRLENIGGSNVFFMLWGKNLTHEEYAPRAIDFQGLGHAGVYWGDPRTVGLNIGVTF